MTLVMERNIATARANLLTSPLVLLGAALMIAAGTGHNDIVSALIAAHASIDLRNGNSLTALMLAVREGHEGAARLLLEAGANAALRNNNRDTAHDLAVKAGRHELVDLLKN